METKQKDASRISRVLRSGGKRLTPQRALLLRIIEKNEGHLDADEIYRLARQHDPRLSLSTVYRTLGLLKELELVQELHFDEEHHHYEMAQRAEHHHLMCHGCGRIVEFESPLIDQLKRQVAEANSFAISNVHIDLVGFCEACRRQESETQ